MEKVLLFETFDDVHHGHVNLLSQAKRYGDLLVIGSLFKGDHFVEGNLE